MSGRYARCCAFVSRRGHSQQRCEQAAVVGRGQGRWPERAPCVSTACFEGVTGGERAAVMP